MSEKEKKQKKEPVKETAEEQVSEEVASEPSETEKLASALAEAEEHILRVHAEFENFKKRTAKEKGELYAAATAEVITRLLPVFDNLERAGACTDFESLKQGVDMILASFHTSLEVCGVREIEALGQEFDPALHNAVLQEETDEFESNTVSAVLQKGYTLGERLVRPAMVKVAQ